MTIDTVIFDMDGVLIDARDWHFAALNEALKLFGYEIPLDEHLERLDGLPTKAKLEILTNEQQLPIGLHSLINKVKQERTLRIAAANCYPSAQHLIMLSSLKRAGIKIGVATNSIRETTISMLNSAGILSFFEAVVTNEDVNRPKPAPDVYLEAMNRLNSIPEKTLVVEDNPHGIQAATTAGCRVCKVDSPQDLHLDAIKSYFEEGILF